MKKQVFVVGHKNPDTDSICAAFAYAELKNRTEDGENEYIAKRAGHLNEETQYVLEYFKVDAPELMRDVSTQVKDIEIRKTEGIDENMSIKRAWAAMTENNVVTLPILNDGSLGGLITVGDVAKSYMDVYDNRILSDARTSFSNIVETLDGELVTGNINDCFEKGKVVIAAANPDMMENYIEEGDMVIVGNRYEAQLCAIELNAGCIIVCDGASVAKTISRLAAEADCKVIRTPYDAYTTARLINQSIPVHHFMLTDVVSFSIESTIDSIRDTMSKNRFRDFPILDSDGKYVGMISRRNILGANKKNVILVDHNEKGQAPDGIEEATILEIIDHHRLGTIETVTPVFFRNQPLGSTSTIIYQMYREKGVVPSKTCAGLLCAAILSDTLMFRSPTCTAIDKMSAEELANIAELDMESFARNMFRAGSNFGSKTIDEIIYRDYKKFTVNDTNFGIGQVNVMTDEDASELKPRVIEYMDKNVKKKEILFFMITNITTESTELICSNAEASKIIEDSFGVKAEGNCAFLDGVVSRKKQLAPVIIEGLTQ